MIGIIGGTGLYAMSALRRTHAEEITTPFGAPSAPLVRGTLHGREVAFLARHGLGHQLLPGEINFRANIWALKSLGVSHAHRGLSGRQPARGNTPGRSWRCRRNTSISPRAGRAASFFGGGLVAHVSTAHPSCGATAALLARVARAQGVPLHREKTYACVEGPRLGTRAESLFLRGAGADLVGMTNVPEAFLALEAQIGYCTIAVATDYDCWLEDPAQHVSAQQVLAQFRASLEQVQQLLAASVAQYEEDETRPCRSALRGALVTPREQMTADQRALVELLLR